MIQIQVVAVPNQTLSVVLANQNAQLAVRQNGAGLYFDLKVNDSPIVVGLLCQDRQRLLSAAKYRGFVGDFEWFDIQATGPSYTDGVAPFYSGIGSRFFLMYLGADE